MNIRKDTVVYTLMFIGNAFFFAAYIIGIFWKEEGK